MYSIYCLAAVIAAAAFGGRLMRIGILTFWWSEDNYGQILQAYALQRYLRDAGHDAYLIRYDGRDDVRRTPLALRLLKAASPVLLVRYLRRRRRRRLAALEQSQNPRDFGGFRREHISFGGAEYTSYARLAADPPEADCYIVGSDQVWNFGALLTWRARNLIHAYFLDFGKGGTMRVAYAASWGRTALPDDQRDEIAPLLRKFDAVAVRERSGVDLCRSCGYAGAEWVCDPTMLLDAEIYRSLYRADPSAARTGGGPYVLFYYLDNGGRFDRESVWRLASSRGLSVRYVTANQCLDGFRKDFATVTEWLALVDGAEMVVTNSFHCCVFSILFGKRFGAVRLDGENEGMNGRLESLFEMTGCGRRYVTAGDFSALDKPCAPVGDFAARRESERFLKSVLGGSRGRRAGSGARPFSRTRAGFCSGGGRGRAGD